MLICVKANSLSQSLAALFIHSFRVWLAFIRFLEALDGKGEYLENNYSDLIITGSTNCVFTGIPLLVAGFTFGKSTNRT